MIRKTWCHCKTLQHSSIVVIIGFLFTYWFSRMITNWCQPWNPGVTESLLMACSTLVWTDESETDIIRPTKISCWFLMCCYWFKVTWVACFCCAIFCVFKYSIFCILSTVHCICKFAWNYSNVNNTLHYITVKLYFIYLFKAWVFICFNYWTHPAFIWDSVLIPTHIKLLRERIREMDTYLD